MAAATFAPAAAQLALIKQDNDNKMTLMRREMAAIKADNASKDQQIQALGASMHTQSKTGRFTMGLSTFTTASMAAIGGAADGWLTAKKSDKIGPVKATSLVGLALCVAGIADDNVMMGECWSSMGRGLVAGGIYEASRQWGERKALESPAAPVPAPAPAQPAAAGQPIAKR